MMKFLDSIDLEKNINIKSQYNNNRKQLHVVHIISRAATQPLSQDHGYLSGQVGAWRAQPVRYCLPGNR